MSFIASIADIRKEDIATVGGKGASLGEMTTAGIPVPGGFVISTEGYEAFLRENHLTAEVEAILKTVDVAAMHTIEHASESIQGLIMSAPIPSAMSDEILLAYDKLGAGLIAVRSSATAEDGASAAWAGQLDTFLNTSRGSLLENVKRCWASLFTPRALFYRFEKSLHESPISVAVVVQAMVQSEVSGIAFSVHPVTQDYNQLIIEAGYGLGEAIVSGAITPDSYVVKKDSLDLLEKTIAEQKRGLFRGKSGNEWQDLGERGAMQKLSDEEISELAALVMRIEKHYGFPVDVEWAFADGKFFITQSRSITTLTTENIQKKSQKIRFVKTYSRDYSMLIEQAWHSFLEYGLKNIGWDCPYSEFVIFYINDGVIEIWENEVATEWVIEKLLEKNRTDSTFFDTVIEQYAKQLDWLQSHWKRGQASSVEELSEVVDMVFESMIGFFVMYFSSIDERTPEDVRKRANELRDKDSYFGSNSKYIRQSLIALYPELEGYEAGMLREEISNPPNKEALLQRKKHGVIFHGSDVKAVPLQQFLVSHPECDFVVEAPPKQSDAVLRGSVGSGGSVTGLVRIVKRIDQMKEMLDGEILVSPMTTPDFLPAMQKAAALVTDEGGIMCHAAIVARELGKPCVIGTKFATQVLHDGDLVEVDADAGIVRIVKRAE